MDNTKENQKMTVTVVGNASVLRKTFRSMFGAAVRLHQYRHAQDTLLRQMIIDDERRIREQHCCYE